MTATDEMGQSSLAIPSSVRSIIDEHVTPASYLKLTTVPSGSTTIAVLRVPRSVS